MLVLARKKNETIVIDGRITIELIEIRGNQIRVGINAPADVKILRGELEPDREGTRHGSAKYNVRRQIARVG